MEQKESRSYPPELLQAWQEGAEEFNSGRYWEAHERWERGWKELPEPERSWIQAWIQLAGALHLEGKGRGVPATALLKAADEKLSRSQAMTLVLPRLEVQGGHVWIRSKLGLEPVPKDGSTLKARLLPASGL